LVFIIRVVIEVKICQLHIETAHITVQGSTLPKLPRIYLDICKEQGDVGRPKITREDQSEIFGMSESFISARMVLPCRSSTDFIQWKWSS